MSLRVGMIGAGNMARFHAEGWHAAGDSISAVLDPDPEPAARLAEDVGAQVAPDLAGLFDMVDVIDVCTPTDTHLDYVRAAAHAGVDVVCEKPLARTGPDARTAVTACSDAGVTLLVGHVVRFFPEYAAARSRVSEGDVGEVAVVRLDRSTYLPAGTSAWFRDPRRSGGVVHDLMIHDVDYARWVAGPVVRSYARLVAGVEGADHALATLRHARGAISHVQGSWAFPAGSFRTSVEIAGSEGLIKGGASESFRSIAAPDPDVPDVPAPPISGESPYTTEIRHFSDVLQGRASPLITPEDAAAAVTVCDGIAESIASGRAVGIEEQP